MSAGADSARRYGGGCLVVAAGDQVASALLTICLVAPPAAHRGRRLRLGRQFVDAENGPGIAAPFQRVEAAVVLRDGVWVMAPGAEGRQDLAVHGVVVDHDHAGAKAAPGDIGQPV